MPTQPNVGRELVASLAPGFASEHQDVLLPGVLRARYSTSPYDWAAALEVRDWSAIGPGSFDGVGQEIFVLVSGSATDQDKRSFNAAKILFDVLTRATETALPGGVTRRASSRGAVTCERQGVDSYRCALGPLTYIAPLEGACP